MRSLLDCRPLGRYPETGLEEINGDLLEADFRFVSCRFFPVRCKLSRMYGQQRSIAERRLTSLPAEHLDLLNRATLGIQSLECLTHCLPVPADDFVHCHDLLPVQEKGAIPLSWFKQCFNRCHAFGQAISRILNDPSTRWPREDH